MSTSGCIIIMLVLTMAGKPLWGQHTDTAPTKGHADRNRPHRFSIMMANAHIPNLTGSGERKAFVLPAWGFDYDYWISDRWAIGLHNDLILQQYKVAKEHEQVIVERNYPVGSCLVGIFKPWTHAAFIAGFGAELESHESFAMYKLGIEYGFVLPKHFELSLNFSYDNKLDAYDTWFFGLAVSKKVSKKH